MKFNFPINNFSSGEWSPKMAGRTDTDQYAKSCEEITNFIPQMTGGATYRGATRHLPLLSVTQTEMNLYSNVGGNPKPAAGAYKIISYTPFDSTRAKILIITPYKWYVWPSNNPLSQEVIMATAAAADIATGNWVPQGTNYTVLGDYIILTHSSGTFRPKAFFYDSETGTYVLTDIERDTSTTPAKVRYKSLPFGPIETQGTSVAMTPSAVSGVITITASSAKFVATDVGSYIRFGSGSSPDGYAHITGFTNSTTVTALVMKQLPNTGAYGGTATPTTFWQEAAWSPRKGYPRTVVAHQGRLIYGGSPSAPDTIWGSRISNYFDFQEVPSPDTTGSTGFANAAFTADNSRPFTLTPNSPEANAIVAMSSGSTLTIHTNKSEIVAYGSNGALGPVNAVFESTTSYGASPVQPVRVNNFVTFVQATGRNVRDIVYNSDEEQFKSTDLAFVAEHFFPTLRTVTGYDTIQEMTKTEGSSSVLWCRTQLGKLYLVTLDRDYRVNAWARVALGGTNVADYDGSTHAQVLSICGHHIGNDTSNKALYALVYRTVNGVGQVSLEHMCPPWELSNPANQTLPITFYNYYLDSAYACEKLTATTWDTTFGGTYPSAFINTTVSVMADGNYIGEVLVSNLGVVTLNKEYDSIYIGYKYKGRIVTSPIEQGGQTGVPMGRIKRVNELVLRLVNTLGIKYGRKDEMYDIPFRESHAPLNQGVEYFTGDKVVTFPPGYDRKFQLVVEQDLPYPCHIVAIIPQGVTYD